MDAANMPPYVEVRGEELEGNWPDLTGQGVMWWRDLTEWSPMFVVESGNGVSDFTEPGEHYMWCPDGRHPDEVKAAEAPELPEGWSDRSGAHRAAAARGSVTAWLEGENITCSGDHVPLDVARWLIAQAEAGTPEARPKALPTTWTRAPGVRGEGDVWVWIESWGEGRRPSFGRVAVYSLEWSTHREPLHGLPEVWVIRRDSETPPEPPRRKPETAPERDPRVDPRSGDGVADGPYVRHADGTVSPPPQRWVRADDWPEGLEADVWQWKGPRLPHVTDVRMALPAEVRVLFGVPHLLRKMNTSKPSVAGQPLSVHPDDMLHIRTSDTPPPPPSQWPTDGPGWGMLVADCIDYDDPSPDPPIRMEPEAYERLQAFLQGLGSGS